MRGRVRLSPTLVGGAQQPRADATPPRATVGKAREAFLAAGDAAAAHYNLGIVHLANGRYAAAARAFERGNQSAARVHRRQDARARRARPLMTTRR